MTTQTSITIEEVKKLAALSRIQLSEAEEQSMRGDISAILGYVQEINQAGFAENETSLPERRNVWREDSDANKPGDFTETLLALAPSREGEYVKVKKIL